MKEFSYNEIMYIVVIRFGQKIVVCTLKGGSSEEFGGIEDYYYYEGE